MINLTNQVIGIPLDECFMCGKPNSTKHHAIPKELSPLRNVTLPLCEEHKDIMHHIIKQKFMPKRTRQKLNKCIDDTNKLMGKLKSIRADLKMHKYQSHTKSGQ